MVARFTASVPNCGLHAGALASLSSSTAAAHATKGTTGLGESPTCVGGTEATFSARTTVWSAVTPTTTVPTGPELTVDSGCGRVPNPATLARTPQQAYAGCGERPRRYLTKKRRAARYGATKRQQTVGPTGSFRAEARQAR